MAEIIKVNDQIHDDLISHDVALRRIEGDAKKRVERRLDRLSRDLAAITARIDPFGTERTDARERRMAKLEEQSAKLVKEAYGEISKNNREDLKRIARIETEASVQAVGKALP